MRDSDIFCDEDRQSNRKSSHDLLFLTFEGHDQLTVERELLILKDAEIQYCVCS